MNDRPSTATVAPYLLRSSRTSTLVMSRNATNARACRRHAAERSCIPHEGYAAGGTRSDRRGRTMGGVSQARELVARSTRWIGGTRDVMLVVAVVLAVIAIVEAGNRGNTTGADVGTAILLGLWATVPVVFLPSHPVAATVAVTAANVVLLGAAEPFVAGVLAELIALFWLGRSSSRKVALPFVLPFVLLALGRHDPGTTLLLVLAAAAVLL